MQCAFTKQDGKQCEGYAMEGSQFCYTHNPEVSTEERRLAQAKGGKAGQIQVVTPLPPIPISQPKDVVALLNDTVMRVREGELDVKTANCLGVLSGHLLKAMEVGQLQERLDLLEGILAKRI